MKLITSPEKIENLENPDKLLFLAGSIEMGLAEPWQEKVVNSLKKTDWIILNPRRTEWDDSWEQTINNPLFKEQVEWELNAQLQANTVLMYFSPDTKSPITLLELGLLAKNNSKLLVVCPEGFWRKGNIEVVCNFFQIPLRENLEQTIKEFLI